MAKEKLTATEWELVKDAPKWVNAALAAADKNVPAASQREARSVNETLKGYKTSNALIGEIMADESDAAPALKKAGKADAEVALSRIASIVEQKLSADDLDALNDLLLLVGRNVAAAANENVLGLGSDVSKKEAAALKDLEVVLRATDAQKKARRDNALKEQATAAAAAKQQADAQTKAEQTRKEMEAKAQAEQAKKEAEQKERLEKAREEAEARKKETEQKERLEKAREQTEARQQEAQAEREALKAREEAARAEAEANARAEAARVEAEKAAAEKQAAPRFTEFIAEHTVVAGDNLSFISQKYYGHQGNFRLIYEANKDVIGDNMSLIRPGQKLRIPKL